ncbi:MAG: hypothetical protein P0Y56_14155 [Candidatus Andeanibacterium colombiense]|uniref:Lipoprotein n=1 Tax=Candidatus Andeanibacterium colombiense TaxID=3121345 RepID=A0AAJ5X531_9SPHN|nr:MAG: hypothetical protein P0Y56_14155 [Sphingomonadaceae bacterium]
MRRPAGMIALAALLAGCGGKEEASPTPAANTLAVAEAAALPEPDLAACPKAEPAEELQRGKPLAIPAAFGKLVRSDLYRLAVVTATGATVCVDTSWIEAIDRAAASPDGRFFSFDWTGYEAGGHVVIDRTGKGQVVDTGATPLTAPGGKRLASVEISASGFGSLNAFAVWDILPVGLKEIAHVEDGLPTDGEWRKGSWHGDRCVTLSYVRSERIPENYEDLPKVAGDPWFAAAANKWKPLPGDCPHF